MASSYSTNLALELIGTGDQAGTWGITTNTNLGTLLEQAISGYVTQAVSTGGDTTITIPNGADGVARNMYIELTGTGGADTNLIVPANKKLYFIFNNSTGAVTVKVSGQTGVSVPTGKKMVLVSNGTDIVNGINYIADFASNSATITNLIATTASVSDLSATVSRSASATITNLLATSLTVSSGSRLDGGVVINEPGADVDFRVEGDTDANLIFADASADRVGVGTNTPSQKLDVNGVILGNAGLRSVTANGTQSDLLLQQSGVAAWTMYNPASSTDLRWFNGSDRMVLDASGNLGVGTTSISARGHFVSAPGTVQIKWSDATNGTANLDTASGLSRIWTNVGLAFGTGSESFAERMRLDTSGNLGVGTTSPGVRLHVVGSNGDIFRVAGANENFYVNCDTQGAYVGNGAAATGEFIYFNAVSDFMSFWTGTTERARITAAGNLLIKTTTSKVELTVQGQGAFGSTTSSTGNGIYLYINDTVSDNSFLSRGSAGNGTTTWYIGNQAITTSSDVRLKDNIVDTQRNATEIVNKLRVVDHTWNDPSDTSVNNRNSRGVWMGLIAQEAIEHIPWLVNKPIEDESPDGSKNYWHMDFGYAVPLLVKAIQEQQAMIDDLKAKVAALKGT